MFDFFLSKQFIWIYSIGIVIFFFKHLLSLKIGERKVLERIDSIKISAKEFESKGGVDERTDLGFKLYASQLIKNKPKIVTSQSSRYFFEADEFIESCLNVGTLRAVPSALTGFGILGTFIGLACSVSAVETSNLSVMETSLSVLLSGAGLAFSTSIVGIASSLIMTFTIKAKIFCLQQHLVGLWNYLDTLFPVVNKANNDCAVIEQLNNCNNGIKGIINVLNGQQNNINDAVNNLTKSIAQKFATEFANGMVQMSKKFESTMNHKLESLMGSEFTASLTGAADKILLASNQFEKSSASVDACHKSAVDLISQTANASMHSFELAVNKFSGLLSQLEVSSTKIIEINKKSIEAIEGVAENIQNASKNTILDYSKINKEAFENIGIEVSKAHTALQETSKKTIEAFNGLIGTLESASSNYVEQTSKAISDIYNTLGDDLVAKYRVELDKFTQSITTAMQKLQKQHDDYVSSMFASAANSNQLLAERNHEIANTTTIIGEKLKQIVEVEKNCQEQLATNVVSVRELSDAFISLKDSMNVLPETTNALKKIETILNDVLQANEKSEYELSATAISLKKNIENLRQNVNVIIDEADLKLANIVQVLNKTVANWNDEQSDNANRILDAAKSLGRN